MRPGNGIEPRKFLGRAPFPARGQAGYVG